jgi:hypothetical protein
MSTMLAKKLSLLAATALVMSAAMASSAWADCQQGTPGCPALKLDGGGGGTDGGPMGEIFRQNQGTISPTTGYNNGVSSHNGYVNAGDASQNPLNNAASPQEVNGAKSQADKTVMSSGNSVYDALLKNNGFTVLDPNDAQGKVVMNPINTVPPGAPQAQWDAAYQANYRQADSIDQQSVRLPGGGIISSFDVPYPDGSGFNHVVRVSSPKGVVTETHNSYRSANGRMARDTSPPPALKGPGSLTITKKDGTTTTTTLHPQATAAQISAGAAKRAAIKNDPAALAAAQAAAKAKASAPSAPHVVSSTSSKPNATATASKPKVAIAPPPVVKPTVPTPTQPVFSSVMMRAPSPSR